MPRGIRGTRRRYIYQRIGAVMSAEVFVRYREGWGYSQSEMGRMLGYDPVSISDMECHRRAIVTRTLYILEDLTRCRCDTVYWAHLEQERLSGPEACTSGAAIPGSGLREMRHLWQYSQPAMGCMLGYNMQSISDMERGVRPVLLRTAYHMEVLDWLRRNHAYTAWRQIVKQRQAPLLAVVV